MQRMTFVALATAIIMFSSNASAVNWTKWDDVTWLDTDSIYSQDGLTYYHLLMLDTVVAYPSDYSDGNYDGRLNCATGEHWDWKRTGEDEYGDPTGDYGWVKSTDNWMGSALGRRICGR
jgi:hypothetical protein